MSFEVEEGDAREETGGGAIAFGVWIKGGRFGWMDRLKGGGVCESRDIEVRLAGEGEGTRWKEGALSVSKLKFDELTSSSLLLFSLQTPTPSSTQKNAGPLSSPAPSS